MNSDIILSMGKYTYVAKIEEAEEGGYIAYFPSLPGCQTQGETLEEVLTMAKEVLELYLSVLKDDGEIIPKEKRSLIKRGRRMNIPLSVSIA
ncbi:MAG: type II toxin-antitoxin system HicB family antitoxin [Patescibacteria group bacterium]